MWINIKSAGGIWKYESRDYIFATVLTTSLIKKG